MNNGVKESKCADRKDDRHGKISGPHKAENGKGFGDKLVRRWRRAFEKRFLHKQIERDQGERTPKLYR